MTESQQDIFRQVGKVTCAQREKSNGHKGCVVWLTGLSASGKSTIATELESRLFAMGFRSYVLDGDNLRHGLCSGLGFSELDRTENIRRIGEVANLFADAGLICIVAAISPYRKGRETVRTLVGEGRFIEAYVHAPLAVLEKRDFKGLYARARSQTLGQFTGISAPYEVPLLPEVDLPTDELTVSASVNRVLRAVIDRSTNLPVCLRPETPEDEDFLFQVFSSTREEELRTTGWPEEVKANFLSSQFKAMRQGYQTTFPQAQYSIVELNGQPIGRLVIHEEPNQIRLVDIALLPSHRSGGVGTLLVRRILLDAMASEKTVQLHVILNSPAQSLYRRLGFKTFEQSGVYLRMQWGEDLAAL